MDIRAFAKVNLTLRVLGARADGYHDLRTTFQSIALHDVLTFTAGPRDFELTCDDLRCPLTDNLIERAARLLWRESGRPRRFPGVRVQLKKRIPMQAGLGGGSADAAAALRALSVLWRLPVDATRLAALGRTLGADVPFCLEGGKMLGLDRGDLLFRLPDSMRAGVVLLVPPFGVSTKDAYAWFDAAPGREAPAGTGAATRARPLAASAERRGRFGLGMPESELVNNLQPPVERHHPSIAALVSGLRTAGAEHAAMSGSGSAVFGLFASDAKARRAAASLGRAGHHAIATYTLSRAACTRLGAPRLR